ncbi:HNH endonuclease [Thalassomonas viridans]|uniref:HNH endonuclease n=1 Tax=Thalassomonas viridans TaxID=137584 RepID=A0AAF0CAQ0_9GAMM|nr:hypothetical protein [Thalassomonas viridans]WDE07108.1 HNH endonuclease [Thalassomonas viridans]
MKNSIFNTAKDYNLAYPMGEGVRNLCMCFLCGQFKPLADLTIEHCTPFKKILEQLAVHAQDAAQRALYEDGFFIQLNTNWFPTKWAAYAYSNDLDNLLLACRNCNSSKGSDNDPIKAILGIQYSVMGEAWIKHFTMALRDIGADELLSPQEERGFAFYPPILPGAGEIGWAGFISQTLMESRSMQAYIETELKEAIILEQCRTASEHRRRRRHLASLTLAQGRGFPKKLTKTKKLTSAQAGIKARSDLSERVERTRSEEREFPDEPRIWTGRDRNPRGTVRKRERSRSRNRN